MQSTVLGMSANSTDAALATNTSLPHAQSSARKPCSGFIRNSLPVSPELDANYVP